MLDVTDVGFGGPFLAVEWLTKWRAWRGRRPRRGRGSRGHPGLVEDLEQATWLALLTAYVGPLESDQPFATIDAIATPWPALPELPGATFGPRGRVRRERLALRRERPFDLLARGKSG